MKVVHVSSWLASVACGVCLVLAVLSISDVARADSGAPCSCCGPNTGDQNYQNCMASCTQNGGSCAAFFCSNCVQPNCEDFPCLCATPGWTCKYAFNSDTACVCRW